MTTASGHTSAIRAKKVIGTTVKNTAGQKIGQVEDIVLDKTSNNIIFAVVGFGGFLGMNEKFHPVPWSALDYDESGKQLCRPVHQGTAAGCAGGLDRQADSRRRRGVIRHARQRVLQHPPLRAVLR